MEVGGQLHLPATYTWERAQSWLGCFREEVFEQARIPQPSNYSYGLIHQKVNATLTKSTESITATTIPVITHVFSSIKFVVYADMNNLKSVIHTCITSC